MKLLTISNTKTLKGDKLGYLTAILHMQPDKEICPHASKGCLSACLNTAGRGKFSNVQKARRRKKEFYKSNLNGFMRQLIKDIETLKRKAKRENKIPVVRLNGTSDIDYYKIRHNTGLTIFDLFPDVQFYDYTKNENITLKNVAENHHYTFSMSEENEQQAMFKLYEGFNVAIVFRVVPSEYRGFKCINGDNTDLRFLDDRNVVVGLTAKGKAKKDTTGFVR